MITKAIVVTLRSNGGITAKTGGADRIFAEQGRGSPSIVIRQTNIGRIADAIPELRHSNIQMLVSGYPIEQGHALSETILAGIEALEGQVISASEDGQSIMYEVKSVLPLNGPVMIEKLGITMGAVVDSEISTFSSNLSMSYVRRVL